MKLRHKVPCIECPWRKCSPAGWPGGYSPEFYADAVQGNEIPACHLSDFGPDSSKTAMCVGALAVSANSCTLPYKTAGGQEARKVIGRRDDCFAAPRDFYRHHANEDYVHPLCREQNSR